MPNYTAKYQFPSPKPTESADGPTGFQNLAQKVEDVLFSQFGKVITAASDEVTWEGDSSPAMPLKAHLTGVRVGDWLVGDPAVGQARLDVPPGGVAHLSLKKAGVYTHILELNDDDVTHKVGNEWRPLPFATFTKYVVAPVRNSSAGSVLCTFPSGRFTVAPIITGTTSGGYYYCTLAANSVNSVTMYVRHYQAVVDTDDVGVNVIAIQTTRKSPDPYLARSAAEVIIRVTCHTTGCDNADIPLDCLTEDPGVHVVCGPCGLPITDVVPA